MSTTGALSKLCKQQNGRHLKAAHISINIMQHFQLLALLLIVSSRLASGQTPDIEKLNYVGLNEILKHQQALVDECRRLEQSKTLELKRQLLEAEETRSNERQHEPITLKLPAVCLLLNGPPTLGSNNSVNKTQSNEHLRLDLVNWLYDYDDLLEEFRQDGGTNNKTKRQVAAGGPIETNEIDTDEKFFQAQLKQMIHDDRYQEAVRLDQDKIGAYLSPVILIPGLAGSRLQARVSKVNRVNIICKKEHDWQEMWLSLRSFLPIAIDCWIDNVRLEYDPKSGFAVEPAGVETRAPSFGSIESVRHLDLKSPKLTKYFDAIIEQYLRIGYQADRNLFAAPYDFRLAPQQMEETFFRPLVELIDSVASGKSTSSRLTGTLAVDSTGQTKKVTLVCHSMGCTHLLVLLRQQSRDWRQTRIRKVVALSSPWGGATKALKAILVGDQFSLPLVSDQKMRELIRTFPSVAYLLPQAEVYSQPTGQQVDVGGPVLVETPEKSYRVAQLQELFQELGLDLHWKWFKESTSLLKPAEPLDDVHIDCLHGSNVDTIETILFRNQTDFPDGDYEVVNGDGDGTVNYQSLLVCAQWAQKYPHLIRHKLIPNTSHTGLLSHTQVLEYLTEDAATN